MYPKTAKPLEGGYAIPGHPCMRASCVGCKQSSTGFNGLHMFGIDQPVVQYESL